MASIIIAIDGFAGTGKSSTARAVAESLEYTYIDSGAMYRAVTLYFIRHQVDYNDSQRLQEALRAIHLEFKRVHLLQHIYLNGIDVENAIRLPEISDRVSEISAISLVRRKLVELQRMFRQLNGIVMDGRDIGTVVFPDADLKIFMRAELEARAKRRQLELQTAGIYLEVNEIQNNLKERDQIDASRLDSPLKMAEDAVNIDTTNLTFAEQVDEILHLAYKKIEQKQSTFL